MSERGLPARIGVGTIEAIYLYFDAGAVVQTVTFRLADSLPREFFGESGFAVAMNSQDRFFVLEKSRLMRAVAIASSQNTRTPRVIRDAPGILRRSASVSVAGVGDHAQSRPRDD